MINTGEVTCKKKCTINYVVASAHILFSLIHNFDSVNVCSLYSDVHLSIACSFSTCHTTDKNRDAGDNQYSGQNRRFSYQYRRSGSK